MIKSRHVDGVIAYPETLDDEGLEDDSAISKAQDFHSMLDVVLRSYIELQNKGFYWDLHYNNKVYPNIEFVLFTPFVRADGEEADNLKNLANSLGVMDRIRFLGWQKNPNAYVAASDVFAAASSHEPLGNIVLEAWAQRVPVVSTKSEGPSWFMTHEQDGLMVEIGDADGFAAAFNRLRSEQGLGKKLIEGGLTTLDEKFSKRVITDAYINLFQRKP